MNIHKLLTSIYSFWTFYTALLTVRLLLQSSGKKLKHLGYKSKRLLVKMQLGFWMCLVVVSLGSWDLDRFAQKPKPSCLLIRSLPK